jgi:hypothetical protein
VLSIQAEERHLQISDTVVAFGSIKTWRSAAGPGLWENRGVSDAQTTTLRIVELKPQETAPHGEKCPGSAPLWLLRHGATQQPLGCVHGATVPTPKV